MLSLLACRAAPSSEAPPRSDTEEAPAKRPEAPARQETPAPAADREPVRLTESDRLAVEAACKELANYGSNEISSCEAAHRFDDFLVIRAIHVLAERYKAAWYVVRTYDGKPSILQNTEMLRGGEEITEPDIVCWTHAAEPKVPEGEGLLGAELRDIDLDGHLDLQLECRTISRMFGEEERRYLKLCKHSMYVCGDDLMLRHVVDGEVELDASVEFRDGKFVRTVRSAKKLERYGDMDVIDKPIADPGRR